MNKILDTFLKYFNFLNAKIKLDLKDLKKNYTKMEKKFYNVKFF